MKKIRKIITLITILLCPIISSVCYGLDTDLYVLSGVNIPPNVLVILDNSASMDEVSSGQLYDKKIDYSLYNPPIVNPTNQVYVKTGNKWEKYADDVNEISCVNLRDIYLIPFGEAINYSGCGISKKDFQTGNFRNYLQLTGGPGGSRPRFGLANGIIHSYINTTSGVRFGVMIFNNDTTGKTVKYDKDSKLEYVDTPSGSEDANGGKVIGFVDENKNGKTDLFNALSGLKNETWSPLAETLSGVAGYFQSGMNGFSSPVQYSCQKNYVLIISDGVPTKDTGRLDDVARNLFDLDLNGDTSTSKQNIKTYTIGFSVTHPLLESTARNGGGKYFYVYSSQSFNIAFQTFIAEVLRESTSYVAPVVPISQMENTSSGNKMYLAMFKPTDKSFWKGNIKKYGIAVKNTDGIIVYYDDKGVEKPVTDTIIKVGDILDANGNLVMNPDNTINPDARSYWSSAADGEDVEKGGVGEILQSNNSRKIFTYVGTEPDLMHASNVNAFALSNSTITPEMLGLASGDITGRNKVIDFIHGKDAYDWESPGCIGLSDGVTNVNRCWTLGAFIHSRPVVTHYGTNPGDLSVIFAGANDGMLHAFDDLTGNELWAFIPPSLLSNLKNLNGEALQFFVDGAPKTYIERNPDGSLKEAIVIFGLRRGGNRYYALDVKERLSPKLLWEISPSTPGFSELGQTWSTPNIGRINDGSPKGKLVAFIGGGYDENQDNDPVTLNDVKGRAVYVVDLLTGSRIWSYSYANDTQMKYSIPSDIARVETNGDGLIERLYVGDMGGRMWRFDIGNSDMNQWTGKIIFNSNPGSSDRRKIFYPPDVTLERGNYDMVFFGTGDRENPKETVVQNRLYAIKDQNSSEILTETSLINVTNDMTTLNALSSKGGWYIQLGGSGEKSLSPSVIFYGVIYYTTFTPTFDPGGDICVLKEGLGKLYALKYQTGSAAFNFDDSLDGVITQRTDKSETIGPSIPSGVILTFLGGQAVAYVGVGGGVYIPPLPSNKTLIPINWRIVF
jgi:type IV pilus assembly protein PilY1